MSRASDPHWLAARLATEAGELLVALQRDLQAKGESPHLIGAQGDRKSHDFLVARLGELCPGDAVLSEEGNDDPTRLAAERTWIIDPLDGTFEFSRKGGVDWGVHVGLTANNRPIAGAVALPRHGLVFRTGSGLSLAARTHSQLRIAMSRSRPPAEALHLAEALGAQAVRMSSAGVKAMAVVRGDCDAYVHSGGQYEWDSCAPVAVALEAGCHASRIDGSPLLYNQPNPYLADLIICRPELAERALTELATLTPSQ